MEKENKKLLSIVIPSWNCKELMRNLLESIRKYVKDIDFEVIIPDDASSDGVGEMIKKEFPEYNLMEFKNNVGFAGNCNRGINAATGKYIALINNDIVLDSNPFLELIKYLEENSKVGAISPRLIYPDGRHQYTAKSDPTTSRLFWQTFVDLHILPNNQKWGKYKMQWIDKTKVQEVEQLDASFIIIRTQVLKDELKGFDGKKFPGYINDVDLIYRLRKLGYKIIYYPKISIAHHHGQSYGRKKVANRVRTWNQGIKNFHLKHFVKNKFSVKYLTLCALLFARKVVVLTTGIHTKQY